MLQPDNGGASASRTEASPLLRVVNLSVGFEATTILRGVSFDVFDGELLAVMGPAGVGKSTLLRTLARYNDPLPAYWAHGRVDYQGQDLLRDVALERARRAVALLAQKAQLYTATVADNVIALARDGRQLTHAEKRDLVRAVLDRCSLWGAFSGRLDHPVTSLSIGEQRMLTVARLLGGGARCVLADEPLRDVTDAERAMLAGFLARLKSLCAVVMITHNLDEARRLSDRVCLLAAGQVVEVAECERFFEAPSSELSRAFLRTGNCWPREGSIPASAAMAPDDGTEPLAEALHDSSHPSWHPTADESRPRPRGFHWILPGRLGGTQWPGLLQPEAEDLRALADLGVTHLVSLTEQPFPLERLRAHGLSGHHHPIADMDVPTPEAAQELCARISSWIDAGESTVIHCKAGLGRTGTLLACCLVYRGSDPLTAISEVREVNRYYIQSAKQFDFVPAFAAFLDAR